MSRLINPFKYREQSENNYIPLHIKSYKCKMCQKNFEASISAQKRRRKKKDEDEEEEQINFICSFFKKHFFYLFKIILTTNLTF